jgi:murein DD-endopeptidase
VQSVLVPLPVAIAFLTAQGRSLTQAPLRSAVVQSIDLEVPFAPVIVEQDGQMQLVHELHVTNFSTSDITITRVRVSDAASQATIADYTAPELLNRLGRPGLRNSHPTPELVGPGMRAIAYFWVPRSDRRLVPRTLTHTVEINLAGAAGSATAIAITGGLADVSTAKPVLLDPPLRGGPWVAVYDPQLKGGHRTAVYAVDGRARIPGRFAIDWIALANGRTIDGKDVAPETRNGNGSEVLAVAAGVVAAIRDDVPDDTPTPVSLADGSGNYVSLDLGSGRFAFYEHLKRGSVVVKPGQRVTAGAVIGRLGSSGSSSIGPHLHFHVSDANSLLGAEGLPFVLRAFERDGAFASIDALVKGQPWIASAPGMQRERRAERPGPSAVVRFR